MIFTRTHNAVITAKLSPPPTSHRLFIHHTSNPASVSNYGINFRFVYLFTLSRPRHSQHPQPGRLYLHEAGQGPGQRVRSAPLCATVLQTAGPEHHQNAELNYAYREGEKGFVVVKQRGRRKTLWGGEGEQEEEQTISM